MAELQEAILKAVKMTDIECVPTLEGLDGALEMPREDEQSHPDGSHANECQESEEVMKVGASQPEDQNERGINLTNSNTAEPAGNEQRRDSGVDVGSQGQPDKQEGHPEKTSDTEDSEEGFEFENFSNKLAPGETIEDLHRQIKKQDRQIKSMMIEMRHRARLAGDLRSDKKKWEYTARGFLAELRDKERQLETALWQLTAADGDRDGALRDRLWAEEQASRAGDVLAALERKSAAEAEIRKNESRWLRGQLEASRAELAEAKKSRDGALRYACLAEERAGERPVRIVEEAAAPGAETCGLQSDDDGKESGREVAWLNDERAAWEARLRAKDMELAWESGRAAWYKGLEQEMRGQIQVLNVEVQHSNVRVAAAQRRMELLSYLLD